MTTPKEDLLQPVTVAPRGLRFLLSLGSPGRHSGPVAPLRLEEVERFPQEDMLA